MKSNWPRPEGLITTGEVAQLLGVHPTTVTRRVKKGQLTPVRHLRAAFLFDPADILAHQLEEKAS